MREISVELGEVGGGDGVGNGVMGHFKELKAGVEGGGGGVGLVEDFGGVGAHLGEEGAAGGDEVGDDFEKGALFAGVVGKAVAALDVRKYGDGGEPADDAVGQSLMAAHVGEEGCDGLVVGFVGVEEGGHGLGLGA